MGFNKYTLLFAGNRPPDSALWLDTADARSGQAMKKDIPSARVLGLSYRIDTETIIIKNKTRPIHFIQIEGWEYTIRNDSFEFPVLSFSVMDMGTQSLPNRQVQNIRILSRPPKRNHRLDDKTLHAAAFLIRQISAGQVPDVLRVLSLYKLQPQGGFAAAHLPTVFNNRWLERPSDPYQA